MTYADAIKLIAGEFWGAVGMMLLFFAGMLLAIPVQRSNIKPLIWLPRKLARMLLRILHQRPGIVRMAAFIFLFNVNAIFLYMLTGVIPYAPAIMAVWVGLNVSLASVIAQKFLPRPDPEAQELPWTARIGALLTFALELPCLWFALALGQSILANPAIDLKARCMAYWMVLAPILLVSAIAEAHAICSTFKHGRENGDVTNHDDDTSDDNTSG
jgi:hypothetical protein